MTNKQEKRVEKKTKILKDKYEEVRKEYEETCQKVKDEIENGKLTIKGQEEFGKATGLAWMLGISTEQFT